MSIAAAIRIDSRDAERVIRHAADFARGQGLDCYVISVVSELPYGAVTESGIDVVLRNLELIRLERASPVIQEGSDVARLVVSVARTFRVTTLFVESARSRTFGRSIAEQLLYLDPPFNVAVVASDEGA